MPAASESQVTRWSPPGEIGHGTSSCGRELSPGAAGMMFFHRHRFVEVARTYVPPLTATVMTVPTEREMIMFCGCTTILTRCECGKERMHQMLGKTADADTLEKMLR